jgi:hypothetical protein
MKRTANRCRDIATYAYLFEFGDLVDEERILVEHSINSE